METVNATIVMSKINFLLTFQSVYNVNSKSIYRVHFSGIFPIILNLPPFSLFSLFGSIISLFFRACLGIVVLYGISAKVVSLENLSVFKNQL